MADTASIRVWDPFVRMVHWALVAVFSVAYFTEEDFLFIHTGAGYVIAGLLLARIFWGFAGTRHARFDDFVYRPDVIVRYLKDTLQFRARRYLGHNPAGGVMVILLMISLLATCITGLVVNGAEENAGPFAHWFTAADSGWGELGEEAHEFLANFSLLLVVVHVLGVITESIVHGENLVSAMITGCKSKETGSNQGGGYE